MSLLPATLEVSYDELAFNLSELIQPAPVGAPRRFQIILVLRNGALAEYRTDLGPASEFTTPEFRIIGGVVDETTGRGEILHTVGELKDMADAMPIHPAPVVQRRDIWGAYYDYLDGKRNI